MKPDNDPLFYHSTLLCTHDSKPSESNSSVMDTAEQEEIRKEYQKGALCDQNNSESDTAQLASEVDYKEGFCNIPELECIMMVEDSINGNEDDVRGSDVPCTLPPSKKELLERGSDLCTDNNGNGIEDRNDNHVRESIAPYTIPSSKMELFEKDTDQYTDKNVLECDLPELIVCHKDSNYNNVVKDICIDEGLPSKEKVLSDSGNGKGLCAILSSDGNKYGGMTGGGEEIELLSHSGSKSSSESDCPEVRTYECGNKEVETELLASDGLKYGGMTGGGEEIELLSSSGSKSSSESYCPEVDTHECGTKEEVETELLFSDGWKSSAAGKFNDDIGNDGGSLVPVQTRAANNNATDTIVDNVSTERFVTTFNKQKSLKSLLEAPDCDGNEVEQQFSQIPCSEPPCESPAVVSAPESKSNPANNLSYNSKVESGTITFDFNSLKPAASGRDVSPDDIDHEHPLKVDSDHKPPLKIDTEPRHEDGISSLAVESENPQGPGESSFSMAGPVSGLITYSGPIAYSGSVSTRSESSTTSARSFAFPVLQNEWNSSPIRMAKADRRHYKRHRGWGRSLLCCRF